MNNKIEITARTSGPDSQLRQLRKEGFIPGVLYGAEGSTQLIKLKEKDIFKHLKEHGISSIFNVEFGEDLIPVKMNEFQKDLINQKVVHIDLQRIEVDKEVEISIPIQFTGESIGVQNGGAMQQQLRSVKIRALPSKMPESIIIDVSDLDIGHNIYVKDINISSNCKILTNQSNLILTILPPEKLLEENEEQNKPDIKTEFKETVEK